MINTALITNEPGQERRLVSIQNRLQIQIGRFEANVKTLRKIGLGLLDDNYLQATMDGADKAPKRAPGHVSDFEDKTDQFCDLNQRFEKELQKLQGIV